MRNFLLWFRGWLQEKSLARFLAARETNERSQPWREETRDHQFWFIGRGAVAVDEAGHCVSPECTRPAKTDERTNEAQDSQSADPAA